MKRADGPVAPRFVRVTPEQYAAFAAEYQGNVKLFRLDESEIAVNAGLLGELLETAATALRTNESVRVKYYTGISHSLHGVMVQGSSRDPSVPRRAGFTIMNSTRTTLVASGPLWATIPTGVVT
jgi:hypothetical protein